MHQGRLAHAGQAGEQHETGTGSRRLVELPDEELKLRIAADEGGRAHIET